MSIPIQDEPESTIGRKPPRRTEDEGRAGQPARASIGREEGDEGEAGSEIRDRERRDPPTIRGLDE